MIDHIAFVVADPKKTAALLEQFGYQVYRETPHHGGSVEMEDPSQKGLIIELCTKRPQDGVGFNHACLRLESREEYEKMVSGGMKFTAPRTVGGTSITMWMTIKLSGRLRFEDRAGRSGGEWRRIRWI